MKKSKRKTTRYHFKFPERVCSWLRRTMEKPNAESAVKSRNGFRWHINRESCVLGLHPTAMGDYYRLPTSPNHFSPPAPVSKDSIGKFYEEFDDIRAWTKLRAALDYIWRDGAQGRPGR